MRKYVLALTQSTLLTSLPTALLPSTNTKAVFSGLHQTRLHRHAPSLRPNILPVTVLWRNDSSCCRDSTYSPEQITPSISFVRDIGFLPDKTIHIHFLSGQSAFLRTSPLMCHFDRLSDRKRILSLWGGGGSLFPARHHDYVYFLLIV